MNNRLITYIQKTQILVLIGLVVFISHSRAFSITVKDFIGDLKSNDDKIQHRAVEYLFESEDTTQGIVSESTSALKDDSALVRRIVIRVLAKRGIKKAIPQITNLMLNDADKFVRLSAAEALGEKNMIDKQSIPALIKALNDNYSLVRVSAIGSLGNIGDKETILSLNYLIKDNDQYVRSSVVRALGELEDKSAVPFLIMALKDTEGNVRKNAIIELGKIGDKAIIPIIKELMNNDPYIKIIDASTRGGSKNQKIEIYPVREEAVKIIKKFESIEK